MSIMSRLFTHGGAEILYGRGFCNSKCSLVFNWCFILRGSCLFLITCVARVSIKPLCLWCRIPAIESNHAARDVVRGVRQKLCFFSVPRYFMIPSRLIWYVMLKRHANFAYRLEKHYKSLFEIATLCRLF